MHGRRANDNRWILPRACALSLQPGIHGFAFKGEDAEDAFVHAAQRFVADEPLQRFDPKGKLPES